MVIKRYIKGFVFVLMIIGLLSAAMAITLTPTGDQTVSNNEGEARNFTITIDFNATAKWYLNGTEVKNEPSNVTSSFYQNNSAAAGFWNVSFIAVNASNSSDIAITRWLWTVNATPSPIDSPPSISGVSAVNIKDTTADITFTVNQSNANTIVRYGTGGSLGSESAWLNNSGLSRNITLSGLIKSTMYNYSVFAYNASNESYFSNSTPIGTFTTADPTAPAITGETNSSLNSTSITIDFNVSQSNANTGVFYSTTCSPLASGTIVWNNNSATSRTIKLTGLSSATTYCYMINAYNATNSSYSNSTIEYTFTTKFPAPTISPFAPPNLSFQTVGTESVNFTATFSQIVNITWRRNGTIIKGPENLITSSFYFESSPTPGVWNISVIGENENGSTMKTWIWTVRPKTYSTGNRVWDGSKDMSTTYTWNPMSFYAFYYDVDSNVGNESLTIFLDGTNDRNIQKGTLKYSTTSSSVKFKHKSWGNYDVIGFMAKKYFAGYTSGASGTSSDITGGKAVSPLSYNQLHEVLLDNDDQKPIYAGSTLTLADGYVLKVMDIGAGRVVMLTLLKDGGEVDTGFVEAGKTYTYIKRVGAATDFPLIAVNVQNVFQGTEANAAFIKGIFQVSESFTSLNSGNRYGIMEITGSSPTSINMENANSFTLSRGATIDIMGDIKFIIADTDNVLRFAPMIKRAGTYEVRGTIFANDTTPFSWTTMNFEGFYYNLNEDIGNETLTLNSRSGTSVSKNALVYSTTAQPVSFKYNGLGQYKVIGFMADKYFAGYVGGPITTQPISTIGYQQLHKVLIDDDAQRVVYAGSTLTLNEGYVLQIKDVNMGAGSAEVWLSLLKDGTEVDSTVKAAKTVYTYAPTKAGVISDLPIIAVRIENIFRGTEATAAFMKGVFQISESPTRINSGDHYGIMEISGIDNNVITMTNPNAFTLSSGSTFDVMGNIKFKVADSSDVRFYPFIMANGTDLSANQLSITVPESPMVKDTITIKVTAGSGTPIENAEVSFDGNVIGSTNSSGTVDYMLIRSGQHTLTATKLGYEKATKTINIEEFRDTALKFELPQFIDQGVAVAIKVISNGTAIPGANVTFNGLSIGLTDSSGILTYKFDVGGTHNLGASKPGYKSVIREITVRAPFTEFKALDINFTPAIVFTSQKYFVWANVSNVGTKNGTVPVSLLLNETAVESKNVTLAPGASQEVNFTRKMNLPVGNYTVEILGQKKTMEVKDEPFNILLVGGVVTALGAIVIYLSTTIKGKATLDLLTAKFNELIGPARK